MLDIQVGDRVKFKDAVVTKVNGNFIHIKFYDGTAPTTVYRLTISEVIKPPWQPVIGEKVMISGYHITYEYRGTIDNQWVLKTDSGNLFFAHPSNITKVP